MSIIRRLTDSCLLVTTDTATTLLDPGFHTFTSGEVDLDTIGDVHRILVTHEHGDHVSPDFLKWLLERGSDITVYGNPAVAALLEKSGIEVDTSLPSNTSAEDVLHETTPGGGTPPNRAWTISDVVTHPGDSYGPTSSAPVLALGLLTPWGTTFESLEFARKLRPRQVVPVHDFYLSNQGREWIYTTARNVLATDGIEFIPLGWGESCTV
jgi:L-ascorbate metabolism protein UlaG (beta-lactamase superfamily)